MDCLSQFKMPIEKPDNAKIRRDRMREAKLKGTHTKKQWENMKLFFKVCVKCEGSSGLVNIEKDHIVPIYLGGSDSIDNIQPLCALCNCRKTSDSKDYRKIYCEKHKLKMPESW